MKKKKTSAIEKAKRPMILASSVLAVILGIGTGWIALENHWVNYPYHDQHSKAIQDTIEYKITQVTEAVKQIQKNAALKSAQDELFFWMKTEMELTSVKAKLGKSPSKDFEEKLIKARENRIKAEENFERLRKE